MSDLATTLIVEAGQKTTTVTLRHPMTAAEIWHMFADLGRRQRPTMVAVAKGTARVTF